MALAVLAIVASAVLEAQWLVTRLEEKARAADTVARALDRLWLHALEPAPPAELPILPGCEVRVEMFRDLADAPSVARAQWRIAPAAHPELTATLSLRRYAAQP